MTFIRLITNYNQLYRMKSISENPNPIDSISYRADTDEAIRICHRITFSTLIKFYIHWFCLLVLLLLREKEKEKYCIFIYYCCCWLDEIWYSIEKPAHAHILWILLFLHRLLSFCCWYTFAETNILTLCVCVKLDCFRKFPSNCTEIARNIEPHTYFDAACFPKMYAVQNYQFQRYGGRSLGKKFNTRPHIDYSLI